MGRVSDYREALRKAQQGQWGLLEGAEGKGAAAGGFALLTAGSPREM